MLRKSCHCTNVFDTKYVQNVTLKANAKKIITSKCVWHQICTKLLLWKQMLRKLLCENAYDAKYVQKYYFEGKC